MSRVGTRSGAKSRRGAGIPPEGGNYRDTTNEPYTRQFVGTARKGWRDDYTRGFAVINGLPGVIVDSPAGPVQTSAFEFDGGVVRARYVVRNTDKLRQAPPAMR